MARKSLKYTKKFTPKRGVKSPKPKIRRGSYANPKVHREARHGIDINTGEVSVNPNVHGAAYGVHRSPKGREIQQKHRTLTVKVAKTLGYPQIGKSRHPLKPKQWISTQTSKSNEPNYNITAGGEWLYPTGYGVAGNPNTLHTDKSNITYHKPSPQQLRRFQKNPKNVATYDANTGVWTAKDNSWSISTGESYNVLNFWGGSS